MIMIAKRITEDTPILWVVTSNTAYRWGRHRLLKPGQRFEAAKKDLPKDLLDIVVPVAGTTPVSPAVTVTKSFSRAPEILSITAQEDIVKEETHPIISDPVVAPTTYRIRARNFGEYYDVVDNRGKKINEQNLTQEEAENMLNELKS